MHCTPCLLILQCLTILLTSSVSHSQTSTHYVGERFSFPCTHGGEIPGRWFNNGVDTNVIAAQFEDTIEVVNGEFNYDGTLLCEGGLSYSMETYGLFGVSPSPLNCSSTDDTTNTCTVYASNKTSLTVCADFTRQPSDAPRFATIHETEWSSDTDRWLWYCDPQCTRNSAAVSVDITPSYSNDWGTCAQVESIQENVVLTFSVLATPYLGTGIGATLHSQAGISREVKFNIQVDQPPSATPHSPTSPGTQTPPSTASSLPVFTSSVVPTLTVSSTSVPVPSPSSSSSSQTTITDTPSSTGQIATGVLIALVVFVSVVAVPVGITLFIMCKMGRLKIHPEKYIKPYPQSIDVISPKLIASRPSDLHIKDNAIDTIESGLPSTSTLKPLLGSNRSSMASPDTDYHIEASVTEKTTPYVRETPSPKGSRNTPDSPSPSGITEDGEDLFSGGLGSIVEKV